MRNISHFSGGRLLLLCDSDMRHPLPTGLAISGLILHGDQTSNMEELYSTEEEADTRLLLHAIHASQNHSMRRYRCHDITHLLLQPRTTVLGVHECGAFRENVTNERYVSVHTIAEKFTEYMCSIIPAVHALSGYDTNSSLHRLGKWTVYNAITKTTKTCRDFFTMRTEMSSLRQREDLYYCFMARRQNA